MPVTIGSIGDIISIGLLIKDIVKCLDNTRGSSAEYQAVTRELWTLDHALLEVELLFSSSKQSSQLSALSETSQPCAERCRQCLTAFKERVNKFHVGLREGGSGSRIRDVASKIRWSLSEKEYLAKFRTEINAHSLALNLLLTTITM